MVVTNSVLPATADAHRLMSDAQQAFADIEERGMLIDLDYVDRAIAWCDGFLRETEDALKSDPLWMRWTRKFGNDAQLTKPQQFASILFGELGYPVLVRTKGNLPSMSDEALEHISDCPFLDTWHDYMKVQRARTNDLIGLRQQTDRESLLHTFFNLNLVTTYRSSSSDINFQNKPNRDPRLRRLVRRAFLPRPGYLFVEADYGALEFRGAACFWKDPGMIAYASDPSLDIHRDMAAEIYALPVGEVSKDARGMAKNKFNFPTLYGSYWKNTGRDLWHAIDKFALKTKSGQPLKEHLATMGLTTQAAFVEHVREVEGAFVNRFSHWATERHAWWDKYLKTGEFPLMTGFVCRGLYTKNNLYNTPVQGPSFHLLLWSMCRLHEWLRANGMRSHILGQIHDSLVLELHSSEVQVVLDHLEYLMTVAVREHWSWVVTPLEIEVEGSTETWFHKRVFHKRDGRWTLAVA